MNKINSKTKVVTLLILVVCFAFALHGCANSGSSSNDAHAAEPIVEPESATEVECSIPVPETTILVHNHVYTETVVEATCIVSGYTRYECECGDVYEDNVVEALGHKYKSATVESTYTSKGYDKHVCEVCEDSYKDNWKAKIVHDCEYNAKITPATCTEKGYTTYTCRLCKVSYTSDETDMIAHKYNGKVTKPTCTAKGYTTYTCVCGKSYKDNETDIIPHDYADIVSVPTCTENGFTLHKCKVCGYKYSDTVVAKIPHEFGKYKSDENATCDSDGTKTAKCKSCSATNTVADSGSMLGHKLGEWTELSSTYHSRKCTRNGCLYVETATHKYSGPTITAPTCTEKGYTNSFCVCGVCSEKTDIVDALGHDYITKTISPTYIEEGYDEHTCSRCKDSYKDNYVEKVPHDCTYSEKVTKPTCTAQGYTTYTCKICKETKIDAYIEALGHSYKQKVIDPKCEQVGYTKNTCSRCGDVYNSNEVPATGHTYKTSTVEATTGWGGYDLHKCTVCKYSYKDNEVPQLASNKFPKGYSDGSCKIVIYKEWYKNAYVYAAHITFSDYSRLGTECANGKYNGGTETTSHAAKRVGAIFAVNGCYSSPKLNYTVVRSGKIWNGSGRESFWCPAVYSYHNGKLLSAWDGSWGTPGISGGQIDQLVADGLVTDTFCFGPPSMFKGEIANSSDTSRAQRTFIGTNGKAGNIWICVSDGRYNDGKSAGLTFKEAAEYLKEKGCTFAVHLDGGGSSTMYFNGKVLNAAKDKQRAVVDFLVFK